MGDIYWPELLCPAQTNMEVLDTGGRFQSPINGFTSVVARPGRRLRMSMNLKNLSLRKRAAVQAVIAEARGGVNAIWCRDHSYRQNGSFSSTERLSNNTFDEGIGTWTSGSEYTLSLSDGVLRATRNAISAQANLLLSDTINVTQYAPYAARAIVIQGRGSYASGFTAFGSTFVSPTAQTFGMLTNAQIASGTTLQFRIRDEQSSGLISGDYVTIPWASFGRCALVDNSPNALTKSIEFDHADWTKTRSTVIADSTDGPGGGATADSLVEDSTVTSTHYITQVATKTAVDQDWTGRVFAKSNTRTQVSVQIGELSSNFANVMVNLTTGAILAGPSAAGTVSNARAHVTDRGNGWWDIQVTATIPSSITTTNRLLILMAVSGSTSFSGNGSSSIYISGASYAASGVPIRYGGTTTTASPTGTSQSLGGGIHTNGWPVSTNQLLKMGDQVQIGSQLIILTSSVNSDSAGRAFLQFGEALRSAPAHGDPVIIIQPMNKWILDQSENGYTTVPGLFSDSEIVLSDAA